MKSMQEKVLGKIEEIIKGAGLDASVKTQWANTGHVYVDHDFDVVLDVSYSFQDTYCSIHLSGPAVVGFEDSPPEYRFEGGKLSWHSLQYVDSPRVKAMFVIIEELLADVTVSA